MSDLRLKRPTFTALAHLKWCLQLWLWLKFTITNSGEAELPHTSQIGTLPACSPRPEAPRDITANASLEIDYNRASEPKHTVWACAHSLWECHLLLFAEVVFSISKGNIKSYTFHSAIWITVLSSVIIILDFVFNRVTFWMLTVRLNWIFGL